MPDYDDRPIEGSASKPVYLSGMSDELADEESKSFKVIDVFHNAIHEGRAFVSSNLNLTVGNNAAIIFHINPDREIHVFVSGAAGGDATIEILENPQISGGAAHPAFNLKRDEPNDAGIAILLNPTVSDDGTNMLSMLLPGGTGGNAGGGLNGLRPGSEIEFYDDKTYAIRLTNKGGSTKPMSLVLEYYSL